MGAKNSESCLIEIQSVGEVSEVILISKLKPLVFSFSRKISKLAQSKL
ncbi:putative/1 [Vibrio mimicus]|nr:putative/1 [Vibrio mimicus]